MFMQIFGKPLMTFGKPLMTFGKPLMININQGKFITLPMPLKKYETNKNKIKYHDKKQVQIHGINTNAFTCFPFKIWIPIICGIQGIAFLGFPLVSMTVYCDIDANTIDQLATALPSLSPNSLPQPQQINETQLCDRLSDRPPEITITDHKNLSKDPVSNNKEVVDLLKTQNRMIELVIFFVMGGLIGTMTADFPPIVALIVLIIAYLLWITMMR